MAATKPPVLLVVLDLNPVIWGSYQNKDIPALSPEISLVSFLHEFQLFVAEYLALGEGKIRIMACTPRGCTFIPSTMKNQCGIATSDEIAGEIRRLAEREAEYACKHPLIYSSISGALSESLCYLNRIMRQNISQQQIQSSNSLFSSDFDMHKPEWGRILLLWASPESSDESQQVINAAFSAKRMNVRIDCCILGNNSEDEEEFNPMKLNQRINEQQSNSNDKSDQIREMIIDRDEYNESYERSEYYQQEEENNQNFMNNKQILKRYQKWQLIAHCVNVSEGRMLKLKRDDVSLYHLLSLHILPLLSSAHWVGSEQSNVLKTVENDSVDLKPKCACHGRTVDIAYVCGRCFTIYCSQITICRRCSAIFDE